MRKEIRVSATCLAEVLSLPPKVSWKSKLPPFKNKNKGEGAGRSDYYSSIRRGLRRFYENDRDKQVIARLQFELETLRSIAKDKRDEKKQQNNRDALDRYLALYGNRKFEHCPAHKISFRVAGITITAQPDLWVRENGQDILIKIGASRKNRQYIQILLHAIRKAAISSGYRVRARNIVYFNLRTGEEICCSGSLKRFNMSFDYAARTIKKLWGLIPVTPDDQQDNRSEQSNQSGV